MDEGSLSISSIVILIVLTIINAFFSAAEIAVVSVNKNRVKVLNDKGNKKAKVLCDWINDPTDFLSIIQVGITLSGFFASASAATGISGYLGEFLVNHNVPYGEEIAFVGVTIILSYITLIFGELFPKKIALQNSEKFSLMCVKPIVLISKIFSPFVKMLTLSVDGLVKLSGISKDNENDNLTRDDLKALFQEGEESGVIEESEVEMLEGVFEFEDKKAEKVMTPRTDVYCIDIDEPLNNYLSELLEKRYTRIPVYEGKIDNIIGILYMKDFILEARKKGFEKVNIRDILIEPNFVPEVKKIHELFTDMKESKSKMAIIIDEYGGFSGIITMEDLVEEIMGDINDEYEYEEKDIVDIGENSYLVQGTTLLDDIREKLNIDIKAKDVDTISGFLINLIGKIPSKGEDKVVEYDNVKFKIYKVSDKRIEKVIITL